MKTHVFTGSLIGLFLFTVPTLFTQTAITVDASKPGHAVPPQL
jgi:hypothetical protein